MERVTLSSLFSIFAFPALVLTADAQAQTAPYSEALTVTFAMDEPSPPGVGSCFREQFGSNQTQTGYLLEPCSLPVEAVTVSVPAGTKKRFFTAFEAVNRTKINRISSPSQSPRTVIFEDIQVSAETGYKITDHVKMWTTCLALKNPEHVVMVSGTYKGTSTRTKLSGKMQGSGIIGKIAFDDKPAANGASTRHGKSGNTLLLDTVEMTTLCNNAAKSAIDSLEQKVQTLTTDASNKDTLIQVKDKELDQTNKRLGEAKTNAEQAVKSLSDQNKATVAELTKLYKEQNDKLLEKVLLLTQKVGSLEEALKTCTKATETSKDQNTFPDKSAPSSP